MAKLAGQLMGDKNTGKVQNRKVAKLQIGLINNVGRTLLLGLPQKRNGHLIECITLLTLISLPNIHVDFRTGVKDTWQGTKLESGKIAKCSCS